MSERPPLTPIPGVRLAAVAAGLKKTEHLDLVLMEFAANSTAACVFTRNRFRAAPVSVAESHLAAGIPRYALINTGYANAGTGAQGQRDAERCCSELARLSGAHHESVLPFSTGVIGEPLPVERLTAALPALLESLDEDGWWRAAEGIMTTDTRPKGATRTVEIAGHAYHLTGISKGAGMIRPNMATMLAFVATDAPVSAGALRAALAEANRRSFNRITVDGDTSTNDACLLVATGAAGGGAIDTVSPGFEPFVEALTALCQELAQAIVRDGEGASRFVTVRVSGGADEAECEAVGFAVAESPLVKTALFAADPNWGRILAAVGRAGINDLDVAGVNVHLGPHLIAEHGGRAEGYDESRIAGYMSDPEVEIHIELGRGHHEATVWTCDLSYEYVRINADYRT